MSQEIRNIVETTWRKHIGLPTTWSPTQIETFLARETNTICQQIETRMGSVQGPAVARWQAEHPGQTPDYMTLVALINTGRRQVTEELLAEALYDKVPEPTDPPDRPLESTNEEIDPRDRWRFPTVRTPEPAAELDDLADRLLPHRSTLVRVMAAHLLQVMTEDGETLPNGLTDPGMSSFTNRLEAGMTADGQPLDGPSDLAARR